MKAAVLEGVGQPVRLQDVSMPIAGKGEAVVKLSAAALNHRDVWIQKGQYAGLKFPIVLGSDGAGAVESVGDGVDKMWLGKNVVVNPSVSWGESEKTQAKAFKILGLPDDGTFAELVKIPAANLAEKPEHLSFVEAAALPLAGLTAYRALFSRAKLQAGETVLITGIGGGVALFGLQFALAQGATVFVTSGSDEKLSKAKALGAAGGVNYKQPDWAKELQAQAGGFDVILDSAGGEGFGNLINLAAAGGRIVFVGATAGNPPNLDMRKIFWKQLSLLGSTMGSPNDFNAMMTFVSEKKIMPVVDAVLPLTDAEAALRRMENAAQFGKIVLSIS
ncbi:MAG: alcohol dehydrogenase [[Candidatus Thermochlorobacteriaceae] bacterium GBChlB]|nr:MAG: alcohol dehydrogenase [[Candidatus Thermochlorobacteriaceae] bacterium GBChlB]